MTNGKFVLPNKKHDRENNLLRISNKDIGSTTKKKSLQSRPLFSFQRIVDSVGKKI